MKLLMEMYDFVKDDKTIMLLATSKSVLSI